MQHCLKHCPVSTLCASESQAEVQCVQLHNLTQCDSTRILPLRRLLKTPTKSHLEQTSPPCITFLPTSRESHSGRALPPKLLIEKPQLLASLLRNSVFPFSGSACHSGALPLASIPAQGSWNCLKSCEENWPHVMNPHRQ